MINGVQRYTFEFKKFRFYFTKTGFYEIFLCFIKSAKEKKQAGALRLRPGFKDLSYSEKL